MTRDLVAQVATTCAQHALLPHGARVVAGVSGGADSLVLLHVLVALREAHNLMLHAAVLDHGIRGAASAADADFVRATAVAWDVPVTVGHADVPQVARDRGLGLEDAARQVRYVFLGRVARAVGADRVAVGHHRDDQAETVLLHLIRGSGIEGLRGMLPLAAFPGAVDVAAEAAARVRYEPPLDRAVSPDDAPALYLIRPLLDLSRAEIDAYAAAHDLHPRDDATNRDPAYTRNRLRHVIIPQLETLNPNLRATLARTAAILRVDADRLHAAGEAAFEDVLHTQHPAACVLDRARWAALHLADQRYVLRAAVRRLRPTLSDLSFMHVDAAIQVTDAGNVGAQAMLPEGVIVQVGEGVIVVAAGADALAEALVAHVDAPGLTPDGEFTFQAGETVVQDFGMWVFEAGPLHAADDDIAALHADPLAAALVIPAGSVLQLRTRQPGDRFAPRGMGGQSQPLTTTLGAMGVPQAWRERVPLLFAGETLAWFVAPSKHGLRGRVSELSAVPDDVSGGAGDLIAVRWWRHKVSREVE